MTEMKELTEILNQEIDAVRTRIRNLDKQLNELRAKLSDTKYELNNKVRARAMFLGINPKKKKEIKEVKTENV